VLSKDGKQQGEIVVAFNAAVEASFQGKTKKPLTYDGLMTSIKETLHPQQDARVLGFPQKYALDIALFQHKCWFDASMRLTYNMPLECSLSYRLTPAISIQTLAGSVEEGSSCKCDWRLGWILRFVWFDTW
jgi:hypothetical protein